MRYKVARFFYSIYQNGKNIPKKHKYTNWRQTIPNGRKIDQMVIKYTNIVHCKTLQNLPKSGFFVWKCAIWQPWCSTEERRPEWSPRTSGKILVLSKLLQLFNSNENFHFYVDQGCQMVSFQTKIPNWVNFGGLYIGKCWYIVWSFGTFYRHLGYVMAIWYILGQFGIFFPVLVCCTEKNLATLMLTPL
jgi:hypothetical protein